MFRQGDVLLIPVAHPPQVAIDCLLPRDGDRFILAHGEATGHAHTVAADDADLMFGTHEDEVFLRVHRGTPLVHEEHESIDLPIGDYRVVRQREFDASQWRPVKD